MRVDTDHSANENQTITRHSVSISVPSETLEMY